MGVGRRVRIEVFSIGGSGTCPMGLEVGRAWEVGDGFVPEGMCDSAYHVLFPYLTTLRFGGDLPWEAEGEARISCPDPANPVVFLLRVVDSR